ncbi:hypothetical protein [Enemella sp. A6]|uniref:hypothetical protein n=1 Tax=Enemella sp. A6 TaxID=3440152 RepID=UPI003EC00014
MQLRSRPFRSNGVRLFDLGFAVDPPQLVDPQRGLTNVVQVADATYEVDATIFDAHDQRMVRSGVVLARRTFAGHPTEWYLDAPDWAPWLPVDASSTSEELPEKFRDAVVPFMRRAELVESAQLHCRRRTWHLRDDQRAVLARLSDDQVTVRRGQLVTGRYREVTLTPVGATPEQMSWLAENLTAVGAARVPAFPPLAERLGAPATGPSDLPAVADWNDATPAPAFVQSLWAGRLRELLGADLALRTGLSTDTKKLVAILRRLRREIRGLAPVLDAEWVADSDAALAQVTTEISETTDPPDSSDYLGVIDRVVVAARAVQVGMGEQTAGELARALVGNALKDTRKAVDNLSPDAPQDAWDSAVSRVESLVNACAIADLLPLTRDRRFTRRAVRMAERLSAASDPELFALQESVPTLTAEQAFEAGREYQRRKLAQNQARADLVNQWPKWRRKLVVS